MKCTEVKSFVIVEKTIRETESDSWDKIEYGIRVNKNGENESIFVVEKDAKSIYKSLGKLLNIPTA